MKRLNICSSFYESVFETLSHKAWPVRNQGTFLNKIITNKKVLVFGNDFFIVLSFIYLSIQFRHPADEQ